MLHSLVFLDPFLLYHALWWTYIQTYFLSSNQCLFKLLFCFDIDIHVGIANQPPHLDFQSLFYFSILFSFSSDQQQVGSSQNLSWSKIKEIESL